ncbi:MAG: O-antigen ligase family protein, partial [Candidatus Paceibacterota bacterium]
LRAKTSTRQLLYGVLFVMFAFILFNTGTRGAALGLIGGSALGFSYLALMAPKGAAIKKWGLGGLLAVVLIAGGLWAARDTALVENSQVLSRFAGVTLAEGGIRFTVWQMALEGVKERPILGWGQENFNYVFNKYYDPALYGAEAWYDRTHNIFLDWLIAGGVIGLLAYLSILVAALWYAVLLPLRARFREGISKVKDAFSVPEQALIFGLLAAYTFHNLFVFDNLASWIFYAVVLALIHSRVSREIVAVEKFAIEKGTWERVAIPTVLIVAGFGIYFTNIPSIQAAQDIIASYRATSVEERLEIFERAYERSALAKQEVAEQLSQTSARMFGMREVTDEERGKIVATVERILFDLIDRKPGDARLHVLLGSFYRATNNLDKALAQYEIALELSPRKQAIIEEMGLIYMLSDRHDEAEAEFRRAYLLDERNLAVKVRLAAALLYAGNKEGFAELVSEDRLEEDRVLYNAFINNQTMLQIANNLKRYDILEYIFTGLIEQYPDDSNPRVNLAATYFEQGNTEAAKAVIEKAIVDIPAFKEEGERLLAGIEEN